MSTPVGDVSFYFSTKQIPFLLFIMITLLFSHLLAARQEHLVRTNLPFGYSCSPDDLVNFTNDGIARTSFLMTPLGAMPYFVWDLLGKGFPDWVNVVGVVAVIILILGSYIVVDFQSPPKLQTDKWLKIRRRTLLEFSAILLNILFALVSAMTVIPRIP